MSNYFIYYEYDLLEKKIENLQYINASLKSDLNDAEDEIDEFKNQEQSLLWTLYSILDGLAIEGEARENAIKEFKEHLKYYKED